MRMELGSGIAEPRRRDSGVIVGGNSLGPAEDEDFAVEEEEIIEVIRGGLCLRKGQVRVSPVSHASSSHCAGLRSRPWTREARTHSTVLLRNVIGLLPCQFGGRHKIEKATCTRPQTLHVCNTFTVCTTDTLKNRSLYAC
jgi:hypothetical protein